MPTKLRVLKNLLGHHIHGSFFFSYSTHFHNQMLEKTREILASELS